jgi:predicted MFS family arabinose efflux permease
LRAFSPLQLAIAGMLTLAAAIGIGRFAFTPVLPMMQKDLGLSLRVAGWLASANYAGYFVGALSAVWLRVAPRIVVRGALIATAVLTAGMGLTSNIHAWVCLRALAGVVSAWALVFSSTWVLRALAASGNSRLGGVVFGGVGLGAALAGVLCLMFLGLGRSADQAWLALSLLAVLAAAVVWPVYRDANETAPASQLRSASATPRTRSRESARLIACYGCSGFGYIIPATFIPALARAAVPDPYVFGWAWPVFGTVALIATLASGALSARIGYRPLWAGAQLTMALGVALPALWPGMTAILACAVCVGGTFVVITMAGLQEARRVAPDQAASLIAAMTAAFAGGQVLGPLMVSLAAGHPRGMQLCLLATAVVLVASALLLVPDRRRAIAI